MIFGVRQGCRLLQRVLARTALIAAVALMTVTGTAQSHAGVMLQGFYVNVPSPIISPGGVPWYWDHIADQANALRQSGFTAIWLPPCLKGASGSNSVGYDPYDDYDLGSKNQKGTTATRYGTREQLERACATIRASGIDIYLDIVHNHRSGDSGNYLFNYPDAYGSYAVGGVGGGRFSKIATDFHYNVPEDPHVYDDSANFGRDLAPVNGRKLTGATHAYVYDSLMASGDWLTKALDVQGYRLDYMKGVSTDFMYAWLNTNAMAGKFAVGEFYDGSVSLIENWINGGVAPANYGMNKRSTAFDFPLRFTLQAMCNTPANFNMSGLDHTGLTGVDATHAVTFVENHDTDGSSPIYQNKMMGYAYILTTEGYPCVFYKDYSTDAGCYGLKPGIDNLVWIHENLAAGTTLQRWKNYDIFAYERLGYPNLLTALNNSQNDYHITCATNFGANVHLHDYAGHEPDVTTDANGNAAITVPKNNNGAGYVCYSRDGYQGKTFGVSNFSTTQEYAGSQDLDIKPADNNALVQVCRIWANAGQAITGSLFYTFTDWTASTRIYLELDDPTGANVASANYYSATPQGTNLTYTPTQTGWHKFRIRSYSTPSTNLKPNYWLRATYTAPQTFAQAALPLQVINLTRPPKHRAVHPDYTQTLRVVNNTSGLIQGPLQLVLRNLPPGFKITSPSGYTPDGAGYITSPPITLGPDSSYLFTVRLTKTGNADGFGFTTQVYSAAF